MIELNATHRLECLDLATQVHVPREELGARTARFGAFLSDAAGPDLETRLGCLRVAVKTKGQEHRSTAEAIVEKAEEYLQIVAPKAAKPAAPQPSAQPSRAPEQPRKRGRQRR